MDLGAGGNVPPASRTQRLKVGLRKEIKRVEEGDMLQWLINEGAAKSLRQATRIVVVIAVLLSVIVVWFVVSSFDGLRPERPPVPPFTTKLIR